MTGQLRQAIKMLRMSQADLMEFISTEVEKNPFLEFSQSSAKSYPELPFSAGGQRDGSDYIQQIEEPTSLRQHLFQQVRSMRHNQDVVEAALIVIDELDDDGYLRFNLTNLATQYRLPEELVGQALTAVQTCDPVGIGARNLHECLTLQLADQDCLDVPMQHLIKNLHLLADGDRTELAKACGVEPSRLTGMISRLRSLDPKPGLKFSATSVQFAIPDVIVSKSDNGTYSIELNSAAFPKIMVDRYYANQLRSGSPDAKPFVSENMANADWLVRSLKQRADTIYRVSTDMVQHQALFFSEGSKALRPLTRREVAERLQLHETTVGRVTSGKYLACEQGVLELRTFFSSSISSVSGLFDFSATAVQQRIRSLIEKEDATRPMSDDRLVSRLKDDGINIARRTVAKYRGVLGVPSSQQRRRRNRMKQ